MGHNVAKSPNNILKDLLKTTNEVSMINYITSSQQVSQEILEYAARQRQRIGRLVRWLIARFGKEDHLRFGCIHIFCYFMQPANCPINNQGGASSN